jgi:predicted nucleic acid-binding protein
MLYLDASALVKRYVREPESDVVREAMDSTDDDWAMCRVGFVETVRAVGLSQGDQATRLVREDWASMVVVEVTPDLAAAAARLALDHELRTLDALHLAAALRLPAEGLTVATFDRRLHAAAHRRGLATLPASLN